MKGEKSEYKNQASSRLNIINLHFSSSSSGSSMASDSPTIFDKIINKEIPSTVVYEDDKVLAFRDINPAAPTHILVIPKVKDGLTGLSQAEERHTEILGHLLYAAKLVAKQEGLEGFRIVINDGPIAGQTVYHIHVHVLGGRELKWPPG
ncbi:14 kDa zinc-binding protein-like [Papaver somniferum]|uniref:14 kDa zinc-binding protein-like n=1 Tax=Papaver somniferum TaxID=3469 RepID=UPI000E6F5B0D|nr:14 kDa zinc-binding protein-like [Papaver somniferum]